jgi:hypothetical protein
MSDNEERNPDANSAAEGGDSDNDNGGRAQPKQGKEKSDPSAVPKSGPHWQHDMRGVAGAATAARGGKGRRLYEVDRGASTLGGRTEEKWQHDKFGEITSAGATSFPYRFASAHAPYPLLQTPDLHQANLRAASPRPPPPPPHHHHSTLTPQSLPSVRRVTLKALPSLPKQPHPPLSPYPSPTPSPLKTQVMTLLYLSMMIPIFPSFTLASTSLLRSPQRA